MYTTKSFTLDASTTSFNTEIRGTDIRQNTTKSVPQQKTSIMQNTQSINSPDATLECPAWRKLTIDGSSVAPPPEVEQEPLSQAPGDHAPPVGQNATLISPPYTGLQRQGVPRACIRWILFDDDTSYIHLSEKPGVGWYPQMTRRLGQASITQEQACQ